MLVFEERGKPEYPEKNLSEQSREPTNSAHIWRRVLESNPGHIGGRRALSPLRQPCSPAFWSYHSAFGQGTLYVRLRTAWHLLRARLTGSTVCVCATFEHAFPYVVITQLRPMFRQRLASWLEVLHRQHHKVLHLKYQNRWFSDHLSCLLPGNTDIAFVELFCIRYTCFIGHFFPNAMNIYHVTL